MSEIKSIIETLIFGVRKNDLQHLQWALTVLDEEIPGFWETVDDLVSERHTLDGIYYGWVPVTDEHCVFVTERLSDEERNIGVCRISAIWAQARAGAGT